MACHVFKIFVRKVRSTRRNLNFVTVISSGFTDTVASKFIPSDAPPFHLPVQTYGDGNCLYRAASTVLCSNEDMHIELRVRTFVELCLNKDRYLDDNYLRTLTGKDAFISKMFYSSFETTSTKAQTSDIRISYAFEAGVLNTIKAGTYSNMWHMFALCNVIGCPVVSVYPMVKGTTVDRSFIDITIKPTVERCLKKVIILWSHISNTDVNKWNPNHFVPLIPADFVVNPSKGESKEIRAEKQAKTTVDDSLPKKRQKTHANKEEEHANKKKRYTGSFLYKASFNLQWTKTWPCIVASKESKHSFCCSLCNKTLSCGKQGVADVKRHVERYSHLKNVKGSKKQVTLHQSCAQAQNKEEKVRTVYNNQICFLVVICFVSKKSNNLRNV
jgi:hypothetical protein